jgi:hypothetical protein
MLGTLFAGLQTSLAGIVSKSFIVSHLLPVTLFLGASIAMATALGGQVSRWTSVLPVTPQGETGGPWGVMAGVVAVTAVALLWSSIALLLFEVLEGKHLGWLAHVLTSQETTRRDNLERRLDEHARRLRALERTTNRGSRQEQMKRRLRDARAAALAAQKTRFRDGWKLRRVLWREQLGLPISADHLQAATDVVAAELASAPSRRADYRHAGLLRAIDGSRERHRFEMQRLMNVRQFAFPAPMNAAPGQSALRVLAPTRFGNVTLTIRSYALDRYGIDLDIFWSRLQKMAQSQDTTYGVLQDAKIQVDFLVSIFWLTTFFTSLWTAATLWLQPSPRAFLAIAVAGPILARVTYLAAVRSYVLFADLARAEVDLFRFKLLEALHVSVPPGNQEESALWGTLGGWMGYGNDADVTYVHKP